MSESAELNASPDDNSKINQDIKSIPTNNNSGVLSRAEKDEDISRIAGALGIASLALGFFLFLPFACTMIAGIVGLNYGFLARKAGVKATAGLTMGWINAIGSIVGALIFMLVIIPMAFDSWTS